ncbi:mucin-2-like [Mytilus trossulus]|uniref:mucin-2-like n=1 Tax=Mytilus trossulus TaxID=6551 RepID=UPI003006FA1E
MYGYNGSPCNVTSICYYGNCVLNELIPTMTSTEAANTTNFTIIESTTEEQTSTGVTELITATEEVTTVETELTTTAEEVKTVETELTTTAEEVTTVETELTTPAEEVKTVETELTTTTETSLPPKFTTETESTEEVTTSATELTAEDPNLPQWSHWTLCRKNCVRLRFRYCGYMENICKKRVKQYEACTNDFCQEDTAKTNKALKGKGEAREIDNNESKGKGKDKGKRKGKGKR